MFIRLKYFYISTKIIFSDVILYGFTPLIIFVTFISFAYIKDVWLFFLIKNLRNLKIVAIK